MYGYRARIGYTSPPIVTEVFPYEFYKMAPPGITLALTTLMVARHTPESGEAEESWRHALRAAREMARAGWTSLCSEEPRSFTVAAAEMRLESSRNYPPSSACP